MTILITAGAVVIFCLGVFIGCWIEGVYRADDAKDIEGV